MPVQIIVNVVAASRQKAVDAAHHLLGSHAYSDRSTIEGEIRGDLTIHTVADEERLAFLQGLLAETDADPMNDVSVIEIWKTEIDALLEMDQELILVEPNRQPSTAEQRLDTVFDATSEQINKIAVSLVHTHAEDVTNTLGAACAELAVRACELGHSIGLADAGTPWPKRGAN